MNLYNVIGTSTMDNLLADPQGADVIAIPVEPGNGALMRGQIMYRTSLGLYKPASTSEIGSSQDLVILKNDVDTGDAATSGAVAEDVAAYRAGHFIEGKVIVAGNGKLTAGHRLFLRRLGIVFDVTDNAGAFHNETLDITYVANNGASPAEPNVVASVPYNTSYTILNNSDSSLGFTAPAGKTFSKWNTKADGSGTDYAAAASYTAKNDLTLYAIWAS